MKHILQAFAWQLPNADINAPNDILSRGINYVFFALGLLAAIIIIYSGIQFMLAAGDPSKVKIAKNTIIWAVVGLIVAALAFVIVNFVIGAF